MENERGREVVEAGNLCERKNGRGVDTNRNWEVHWGHKEKDYDPAEEYPGTHPFRRGADPADCARLHVTAARKPACYARHCAPAQWRTVSRRRSGCHLGKALRPLCCHAVELGIDNRAMSTIRADVCAAQLWVSLSVCLPQHG